MRPSPTPPLALPPALTYLLARAIVDFRRRAASGGAVPTQRLDGLFRDAIRHLTSCGATPAEIHAALDDVAASVGASLAADLQDDLTAAASRARAVAALPRRDRDEPNGRVEQSSHVA